MSTTLLSNASLNGIELWAVQMTSTAESADITPGDEPDPAWEHVDQQGHYHAWARGEKLPSLVARELVRECDGTCGGMCEGGGHSQTLYHCYLCGEEITPGRRRVFGRRYRTTATTHTVTVDGPAQLAEIETGTIVSIRCQWGFGRGTWHATEITLGGDGGVRGTVDLADRFWTRLNRRSPGAEVADLNGAIRAAASAIGGPWRELTDDEMRRFGRDFPTLAAARALQAALPHLGLRAPEWGDAE